MSRVDCNEGLHHPVQVRGRSKMWDWCCGWLPWSLKKSDVRAVVSAEEVFTESIMEFQGGKERDPSSHMSGLTGAVLHIYLTKGFLKICLGL